MRIFDKGVTRRLKTQKKGKTKKFLTPLIYNIKEEKEKSIRFSEQAGSKNGQNAKNYINEGKNGRIFLYFIDKRKIIWYNA